jgi:hypothetical protein
MRKSLEHLQLGTTEDEEDVVFEPDEEYVARMGGQAATSLRQSSGTIKAVGFAAQDEGEKAKVERFSRLHTKYDFIKVKVWLEDHYYIMSRFIVSRMLTLIKVSLSPTPLHHLPITMPYTHQLRSRFSWFASCCSVHLC